MTKNIKARIINISNIERKSNIKDIKTILDYLIIKRTIKSTFINSIFILVTLSSYKTRRIKYSLNNE